MPESHEHEVIQFELSKQLEEKLKDAFYDIDNSILTVYVKSEKSKPIVLKSKVDKSSMRKTIEQFNERADGTLDKEIKALFVSSIRFQLGKYIKFDDTEQKWYSENYSDDPIVDKEEDEEEKKPKKIAIKKYSGNGKRPFHDDPESLRIETKLSKVKSKLVCPRCKKEKEDEDCLYDVYFEVKGIERSSHEGWVLDDFEYRVCGSCQNEIERYIRI